MKPRIVQAQGVPKFARVADWARKFIGNSEGVPVFIARGESFRPRLFCRFAFEEDGTLRTYNNRIVVGEQWSMS